MDAAATNPLLAWPQPLTDRPDAAFRRQFSDAGQCFHYMATLDDAQTEPLPGTSVPRAPRDERRRALQRPPRRASAAGRRIRRPRGTPEHARPLRVHARRRRLVLRSHAERAADGKIGYLRVWQPIERLVKPSDGALGANSGVRVPQVGRPPGQDVRDRGWRRPLREAHGPALRRPLRVSFAGGRRGAARARRAPRRRRGTCAPVSWPPRRDATRRRSARPPGAIQVEVVRARPACEGAECAEHETADPARAAYAPLGLDDVRGTRRAISSTSPRSGTLLKYS